MTKAVPDTVETARALSAVGWLIVAIALFPFALSAQAQASIPKTTRPSSRRAAQHSPRKTASQKPRIDYSQFSHRTHVEKQKLACDSCHKFPTKNWKEVRKADAAFADVAEFPEHSACLTCHRQQFFARERPAPVICSNCHVNSSPRDTTRFLFPSLGDVTDATKKRRETITEFQVNFPHDKHMEVLARGLRPAADLAVRFVRAGFQKEKPKEESQSKICAMCHQTYAPQGDSAEEYVTKPPKSLGDAFWLKKGSFKTIPVSHTPCATCHSTEGGIDPAPAKCEVCHKLLPGRQEAVDFDPKLPALMGITDSLMLNRWKRRASAGAFTHEGGAHPAVSCTTCHNVPTMNTTELKSLKVAVKSCAGTDGCHITATTDEGGALNFEIDQRKAKPEAECTKCHLVFGKQPLPASHIEAIPKAVKK